MPHLTDEQRDYWARRRFDQEVAVERHRHFLQEIGHTFTPIERNFIEGEYVDPDDDQGERAVPSEPWREARESDLPSAARSLARAARKANYGVNTWMAHGERRGAHGRLLKPPEGDYALVAAAREGGERFTAEWGEADGKWSFLVALDFTPGDHVIPRRRKTITELKKERL